MLQYSSSCMLEAPGSEVVRLERAKTSRLPSASIIDRWVAAKAAPPGVGGSGSCGSYGRALRNFYEDQKARG
jgi:hypothetical protein